MADRDLQSKLEALTQAAVGALGFLPVNVPGARMAKERIEAVLGEIGAAVPSVEMHSIGHPPAAVVAIVRDAYAKLVTERASALRAVVCGWREETEADDSAISYGPECGQPATHVSCVPFARTPTCAAHKCRCAKPLPKPRAIVVGSTWREYSNPPARVEVVNLHDDGGGLTLRNTATNWRFAMTLASFRRAFEWISDPPVSEGEG